MKFKAAPMAIVFGLLFFAQNEARAQWGLNPEILTPTSSQPDDFFGATVAMDGTTAIVCNRGEVLPPDYWTQWPDDYSNMMSTPARAQIFEKNTFGNWVQKAQFDLPNNLEVISVALRGNLALVGLMDSQTVRVYQRFTGDNGSSWQQTGVIAPAEAEPASRFGTSLAISENGKRVVVGAPFYGYITGNPTGAVYVFDLKKTAGWIENAHILPSAVESYPNVNPNFGATVSISGDGNTIAAGAPFEGSAQQGSARVFENEDGVWFQRAKLKSNGGNGNYALNRFGSSVALSGNDLVVGAPVWFPNNGSVPQQQAAYFYERDANGSWLQKAKFSGNKNGKTYMGFKVALQGDKALVSAPFDNNAPVYVYKKVQNAWSFLAAIDTPSGHLIGFGGGGLALENNQALIGAYFSPSTHEPGKAYLYAIEPGSGSGLIGDINGDQTVNQADLTILLSNFGTGNASYETGDLDGNTSVDQADLGLLIGNYGLSN